MKIAITGATGFLGFRAAELLTERGHTVVGLGRDITAGARLELKGIRFVRVDLADRDTLTQVFSDCEYAVHCAALAAPWGRHEDFVRANVTGTANVILAARQSGLKRLVHISTPSIYISGDDRENVREDDPLPKKFINSYASTKWEAEELIDSAFREGLAVVTLRPQGLFGPGDPHILPSLLRLAERGRLPVIGSGRSKMDLTYVDNVVDAIEAALIAPTEHLGKKYNVTNGEPVEVYPTFLKILSDLGKSVTPKPVPLWLATTAAWLVEFVHRRVLGGKTPPITLYSVNVLSRSRTLSIEAIRKDLGYFPRISMEEGLRRMIAFSKGLK